MELQPFNFKLLGGTEIIVTAEVTSTDVLIGLTFPIGCRLDQALTEAVIQQEEIEDAAIERYRTKRRENQEAS